MIGALMVYAFVVSLFFAIAALATEQAFAIKKLPRRIVWSFALCASVGFPFAMAFTTPPIAPVRVEMPETPSQSATPESAHSVDKKGIATIVPDTRGEMPNNRIPSRGTTPLPSLDNVLEVFWPATSAVTMLWYSLGWLRLKRFSRRLPRVAMDGVVVRLTNDIGPAVLGSVRPVILMPRWLVAAAPPTLNMALEHEKQHLATHDPALLAGALLLVTVAPWNPALWWQLHRLRFAIEADCDRRVLLGGIDQTLYGEALLQVGQHRVRDAAAFMALTSTSWLEQRIRIMLSEASRLSGVLAGSGVVLAVALMIGVAMLRAPGFAAPAELRKLPPQDTMPAAEWARSAARERYPELFEHHFEGSAVLAFVFGRNGQVKLANKHLFPPGTPVTDIDEDVENTQLQVDPQDDILYAGRESSGATIGPWLESKNLGRLSIVYEVLKWPHDPSRTRQRVQAAIAAYDPELIKPSPTDPESPTVQMTVFMNDDGTVDRASKTLIMKGQAITEDELSRFSALGVSYRQLGRRGFASGLDEAKPGRIFIDYAWPRRSDDDPDVAELNTAWRQIHHAHPAKEDDRDDPAIVDRYFSDIQTNGNQAVTVTEEGRQFHLTPWILFGRDGRVWDTGRWRNEADLSVEDGYKVAWVALENLIEARYPGIKIGFGGNGLFLRVKGVPIQPLWIAPDSPIQTRSAVDMQSRRDLLLTGAFLLGSEPNPHFHGPSVFASYFTYAVNFGVSTEIGQFPSRPLAQVTAKEISADQLEIQVRTPEASTPGEDPTSKRWSAAIEYRIPYGGSLKIDVSNLSVGPASKIQIVLRPQRVGAE